MMTITMVIHGDVTDNKEGVNAKDGAIDYHGCHHYREKSLGDKISNDVGKDADVHDSDVVVVVVAKGNVNN